MALQNFIARRLPTITAAWLNLVDWFFQAGVDSGAANAYVISFGTFAALAPFSLSAGQVIRFTPQNTNTGASTANAAGTGVKSIVNSVGGALTGGELIAGYPVLMQYDGTKFIILGASIPPGRQRTAGEISAGVTPVNFNFDPGVVDRYGVNTTPGTTDMTTAFNSAIQVASKLGCNVTWGSSGQYRLNSPVNATQVRGIIFRDLSSREMSSSAYGAPSIIIGHTGHGFDLSASTELSFKDVVATNVSGTVPKTLFFMARNAVASGAGIHRFDNIRTPNDCTFSHIFYSYASEENVYLNCELQNSQAGSSIININATNPSAYTSTFLTIATGNQSNASHYLTNCNLLNYGNSGSSNEVCINLERANNFSWHQGLAYCPHGLAYISVTGTIGCVSLGLRAIRGETDGVATTQAGIAVRTTAATGGNSHTHWTLDQVEFYTAGSGYLLDCNSTSDIVALNVRDCFPSNGNLMTVHSLSYSDIVHGQAVVTGQAGGTVANSSFEGSRANITFSGTDSLNTGFDQNLGRYWETGDSFTSASTACTGAITANVVWTLTKFNRHVQLALPSISATATAATSFTVGATIPAAYRPAAQLRFPIIIRDNGGTPNQVGMVIIATSGVITVFKDILATANFTAAAGAGLPDVTEVSWTI